MKILIGKVLSIGKMSKTAVVRVETSRRHPLYKKIVKKRKNFLVHLEEPAVDKQDLKIKQDDLVKIVETRPISKNKHFKIIEVLR